MKKTKPIKKIMIFAIITVMIASLFAVPAFAALPFPANPPENESSSHSIYVYIDNNGQSVDVTGYYMIEITGADLDAALAYMYQHDETGIFNLFGIGGDYLNGYVYITYFDGGSGYQLTAETPNFIRTTFSIDIRGSGTYYYCHGGTTSYYRLTTSDVESIRFYLRSYPPDVSDATLFWEGANYTVTYLAPISTDPDPDTPTDTPTEGEASGIFAVWTAITDWVIDGLASVTNAFYYNGELTLLGYLCIIPLALGVGLLLISIIQKFLHLRG